MKNFESFGTTRRYPLKRFSTREEIWKVRVSYIAKDIFKTNYEIPAFLGKRIACVNISGPKESITYYERDKCPAKISWMSEEDIITL